MMKKTAVAFVFILMLAMAGTARASVLRVKIFDAAGGSLPDVLVIVRPIDRRGELYRILTDSTGSVPERDVPQGLYRIIATCPYGICQTKVSEFVVGSKPVELVLNLEMRPLPGNVTTIWSDPKIQLRLKIVDSQNRPLPSVYITVRDPEVPKYFRWVKTDARGEGQVVIPPLGPLTVVVAHDEDESVTERNLSSDILEDHIAKDEAFLIQLD